MYWLSFYWRSASYCQDALTYWRGVIDPPSWFPSWLTFTLLLLCCLYTSSCHYIRYLFVYLKHMRAHRIVHSGKEGKEILRQHHWLHGLFKCFRYVWQIQSLHIFEFLDYATIVLFTLMIVMKTCRIYASCILWAHPSPCTPLPTVPDNQESCCTWAFTLAKLQWSIGLGNSTYFLGWAHPQMRFFFPLDRLYIQSVFVMVFHSQTGLRWE